MSGALIMIIAIVAVLAAYIFYGRYLARKWGANDNIPTPATTLEDENDEYNPTDRYLVFGHQFSTIAGAAPITGPIQAAVFGWLPVVLWCLIGGIFVGAMQDYATLFASVRNKGRSIGYIIEQYLGKFGKRIFLIFVYLMVVLVIAAFTDIVVQTFAANDSMTYTERLANSRVASTSFFFILFAVLFGFLYKKLNTKAWVIRLVAIVMLIDILAFGYILPIKLSAEMWTYLLFAYLFISSVLPIWVMLIPRDFLSTYLFLFVIFSAIIGIFVANPVMNLPAFAGFFNEKGSLFPVLFVTVACGAVSGAHTLTTTGTTPKQIKRESDMLPVAYGSMLIEVLIAIIAIIAVSAISVNGVIPSGTPQQIFATAIAGFLTKVGLPMEVSFSILSLAVSAFAFTTLDSIARVGRLSWQELFFSGEIDEDNVPEWKKALTNKYVASAIILVPSYVLSLNGYEQIWALFGSANQLLSALSLCAVAIFFKKIKKFSKIVIIPTVFMLLVSITALIHLLYKNFTQFGQIANLSTFGQVTQIILTLLLLALAFSLVIPFAKKIREMGKMENAGLTDDDIQS